MDELVSVFFVWNLFDSIFPDKCKNGFIVTGLNTLSGQTYNTGIQFWA